MTSARRVALYCATCDEYYFPDEEAHRAQLEQELIDPSPDSTYEHSVDGEVHSVVPAWRELNS